MLPGGYYFIGLEENNLSAHKRFCLRDEYVIHEVLRSTAVDQHGDRVYHLKVIAAKHS